MRGDIDMRLSTKIGIVLFIVGLVALVVFPSVQVWLFTGLVVSLPGMVIGAVMAWRLGRFNTANDCFIRICNGILSGFIGGFIGFWLSLYIPLPYDDVSEGVINAFMMAFVAGVASLIAGAGSWTNSTRE